jgi:hypothetical protein
MSFFVTIIIMCRDSDYEPPTPAVILRGPFASRALAENYIQEDQRKEHERNERIQQDCPYLENVGAEPTYYNIHQLPTHPSPSQQ